MALNLRLLGWCLLYWLNEVLECWAWDLCSAEHIHPLYGIQMMCPLQGDEAVVLHICECNIL